MMSLYPDGFSMVGVRPRPENVVPFLAEFISC